MEQVLECDHAVFVQIFLHFAADVAGGVDERTFEPPEGPVGTAAAVTCVYGTVLRNAGSVYHEGGSPYCELGGNFLTPVEALHLDFIVHEDLDWAMSPEVALYGRMHGGSMRCPVARERRRLPLARGADALGRDATTFVMPQVPDYQRLTRTVFDALGWRPERFSGFRFSMPYPPVPSVALFRCRRLNAP